MLEKYNSNRIESRNTYQRDLGVNKHVSLQKLKENSVNLTDISSNKLRGRNNVINKNKPGGRHGSNPSALENLIKQQKK